MSKKSRIVIFTEKKPCGMPIAGQGLIFPKIDRFKELFALLDFENQILKMTISTMFMHQKNQIGPQNPKIQILLYIRGAGGRGEALR